MKRANGEAWMTHDHVSAQPQSRPICDAKWTPGKVTPSVLGAFIGRHLLRETCQHMLGAFRALRL